MRRRTIDGSKLLALRGLRSREVISHALRHRGHATDAKAIWRWENNRNQPSAAVLADLADVLGAPSVESLYEESDEEAASMSPMARDQRETMLSALAVALEPFHPRNREGVSA